MNVSPSATLEVSFSLIEVQALNQTGVLLSCNLPPCYVCNYSTTSYFGLLWSASTDGPDGNTLLGVLDSSWLVSYAISTYIR